MRRWRLGAVWAAMWVASAWVMAHGAGEAAAGEAVDGRWEEEGQLLESESAVEAVAAADRLEDLKGYLPADRVLDDLGRWSEEVDEPWSSAALRRAWYRARLEMEEGDGEAMQRAYAEGAGCLVDWEVLGPLPNESMQGFDEALAVERGEAGPYEGRRGEVDWRPLGDGHYLCAFQLGERVRPATASVAYLSTTIALEEAREATLVVGSRSAYQVWVNGEPVGQRRADLGFGVDAEGWEVALEAGDNEVLVKLGSTAQGGLAWMARLVDEAGEALAVEAQAGWEPREVEAMEAVGEPTGGLFALIQEGREAASPSTRLAAAEVWKSRYGRDAGTPWRDVADALWRAPEELEAGELVRLAALYEEHWQRQAILEAAWERAEGSPWVALARARERGETLSALEVRQKERELEALVEEEPRFLMARLALADLRHREVGSEAAYAVLAEVDLEGLMDRPYGVRRAADWHRAAGSAERVQALREAAASLHRLSGVYGWQWVREEMAGQRSEEALERVRGYASRDRGSLRWPRQEALILRSVDRLDEAIDVVEAMLREAPGNADLYQQLAQFRALQGDREAAMAAVREAIALRPQSTRYQEYLEFLQPESGRFYEPWHIGDLRGLAAEVEAGSQSYDILVNQRIQQVASNGLSRRYVQRAHRVLRDEGVNGARRFRVSYQPGDERVEVIGVRVIRADGTVGEDFDTWRTEQTRQSQRMYNDRAHKNMRANHVDVGDVVEFQYVVHQVANENFRGDYFGDVHYVQQARPIGLARYAVHYPEDWELYFRDPSLEHRRFEGELPDGSPVEEGQVTAYELRDVPRVHTESDQPGSADIYDYILASNKQTYDEIGRWWWELIEEQLVVDDAIRGAVQEVTEGVSDDREMLEAIHAYVVRNTRYLHLGLGIHGWKPYRTSTVFRNQYGDCKDKAALLKVMLEEVGIEAELVLVRTRRLGHVDPWPANIHVFNHAAVYLPSMDLFVDPTARYNGPYELTQMDQGAQALIVRDGGAETEWLEMPIDEAHQNRVEEVLYVDHDEEASRVAGMMTRHGTYAVSDRRRLEDEDRRREVFERQLNGIFPGASLLEAQFEELDSLTEPTRIDYEAQVPGVFRGQGEERRIHPYVVPRELLRSMARSSTRRQDLVFRTPYERHAVIEHRLPEGWEVARTPDPVSLETPFGRFYMESEDRGDRLEVRITYGIEVQRVSVDDYGDFRAFVGEMDDALDASIAIGPADSDDQGGER